jgi:hypothetical protein
MIWARPLPAEPVAIDSLKQASPASNQQIEEVADALKRFRTGDLDGAKTLLDTAFKKHPELPPPRLILVQWLAQSNQGAAVRQQLELAVTEMPEDPEAYVIIGEAQPGFVLVVDGRVRKLERPKKKNIRHLVVHHVTDPELMARLASGEPVTDELIRRALKRLETSAVAVAGDPIAKEAEV